MMLVIELYLKEQYSSTLSSNLYYSILLTHTYTVTYIVTYKVKHTQSHTHIDSMEYNHIPSDCYLAIY